MKRPGKEKPSKKKLLPPSSQQLQHAKSGREGPGSLGTYFGEMSKNWKTVVRPPVEDEAPPVPIDDANLPAYLRHRPTGRTPPLFFRTKAVVRTKRK